MAMEHTWKELCWELLEFIARKLSFDDAIRFSCVCVSWRRAADTSRVLSRPILLTNRVIRTDFISAVHGTNCADGRVSRGVANSVFCLKQLYHQHFVGSSKNMVVIHSTENHTAPEIVLLNPFSLRSFHFPLATTDLMKREGYPLLWISIPKAVVLSTSEKKRFDELNLILVIIQFGRSSFRRSIAYCHAGLWADLDRNKYYTDIIARERRLFAMSFWGTIKSWDFDQDGSNVKPVKVMSFDPSMLTSFPVLEMYDLNDQKYLIESMGEFLLVTRLRYESIEFRVYKSCLDNGNGWVEVESLEGMALFLGKNESASVSTRDLPTGYEGNSIYFCDEYVIQVYNLTTKTISDLCVQNNESMGFRPSCWMV